MVGFGCLGLLGCPRRVYTSEGLPVDDSHIPLAARHPWVGVSAGQPDQRHFHDPRFYTSRNGVLNQIGGASVAKISVIGKPWRAFAARLYIEDHSIISASALMGFNPGRLAMLQAQNPGPEDTDLKDS